MVNPITLMDDTRTPKDKNFYFKLSREKLVDAGMLVHTLHRVTGGETELFNIGLYSEIWLKVDDIIAESLGSDKYKEEIYCDL